MARTRKKKARPTSAVVFPFDLFGSPGAREGAELIADALREMLDDNRRERRITRAQAYTNHIRIRDYRLDTMSTHENWRRDGRNAARQILALEQFLLWLAGNHLAVLPVYEELARPGTLVVQFDAHLDVYNLSDCTAELSHGNFLLHCAGPLPGIINVGSRELLLRPEFVSRYYRAVFPAAGLATDPAPALEAIRKATSQAQRVFVDIDCDVLDPAFFPATSHRLPFGISPALLLRVLDAAWSERVIGIAISEFVPGRDRDDQSLALLVWLLEYLLLKRYEPASGIP